MTAVANPPKERPILFSAEMVRAILEGKKTQTRRIVKMPKKVEDAQFGYTAMTPRGHISVRGVHASGEYGESFVKCPYGAVGDRLWVRENFATDGAPENYRLTYAADGRSIDVDDSEFTMGRLKLKSYPSIHMPRWASRILLEATDVRVERLQAISEADAIAEGVVFDPSAISFRYSVGHHIAPDASGAYMKLWREINGDDSWRANPWVWVVSFRKLEGAGA